MSKYVWTRYAPNPSWMADAGISSACHGCFSRQPDTEREDSKGMVHRLCDSCAEVWDLAAGDDE